MGYTTEFEGSLSFDKPLTQQQADYINAFAATRRMKRDAALAETLQDDLRKAVGLPIGTNGGYFVGNSDDGDCGQTTDKSVTEYNYAPNGQPGLWCQWIINDEGELEWDGNEKFYAYVEWLEYLIKHFFNVWGRKLNGEIKWQGEGFDDRGKIVVVDSKITTTDLE